MLHHFLLNEPLRRLSLERAINQFVVSSINTDLRFISFIFLYPDHRDFNDIGGIALNRAFIAVHLEC